MSTFDDIERRREANEGVHPAPDDLIDEEGSFAVRVVFLDGVDRTESSHTSLRRALFRADTYRYELEKKGYRHHNSHVGVIDSDDPERGELDWDEVGG